MQTLSRASAIGAERMGEMAWNSRVRVKHLFTNAEDHASVQACMNAVADVLDAHPEFMMFDTRGFRNISEGDDMFGPREYANKHLARMYDYADLWRIWVA